MKIVLEFESLQDLEDELSKWVKAKKTGDVSGLRAKADQKIPADIMKAGAIPEEAKKVVPFEKAEQELLKAAVKAAVEDLPEPTPAPEPVEKVKGEEIMPAPVPQVDESYRIEVRKTLAKLNKKTGENTASKLIKGFGVDKLTEVALKDLPELMRQAEEALNA